MTMHISIVGGMSYSEDSKSPQLHETKVSLRAITNGYIVERFAKIRLPGDLSQASDETYFGDLASAWRELMRAAAAAAHPLATHITKEGDDSRAAWPLTDPPR